MIGSENKDDFPSVRLISLATEAQAASKFLSVLGAGTVEVMGGASPCRCRVR
jgi:hypothetical protein